MQQFTSAELDILKDTGFLITKNAIQTKILKLLSDTGEYLKTILHNEFSEKYWSRTPESKVSRGENYRLLPYYVLDCPRCLKPETMLNFRTLVWWGHELSFSLLLAGKALVYHRNYLLEHLSLLDAGEYYWCVHPTPWENQFDTVNMRKINTLDKSDLIALAEGKGFIKISRRFSLDRIEDIPELAVCVLKDYLRLLKPAD